MNRTMNCLLLVACLLPAAASAEVTPPKGQFDPRVRVVDYNPLNVVKLRTFYGVSTHIQLAEGETVKDVAMGDAQAWKIKPRGNHIFIKPEGTHADTNMTIVSDRRTYQFVLAVQPLSRKDPSAYSDTNLVYSLTFNYPEEEAAGKAIVATRKAKAADLKTKLASAKNDIRNLDYWVAGSEEISPTVAYDDGRFIYLSFSNNRDMPAIYSVDPQGKEALINTNVIDGKTIVIQRMVPSLMLRKGDAVASVINKSFNLNNGIDMTTGTVSPEVERLIKGAE